MSEAKLVKISSAQLKAKRQPPKPKFGAKVAFILAQPADRSAVEIVADGAKQGLVFAPIYVHTVRLRARKSAGQPPKRRGRKPKSAAAAASVAPRTGTQALVATSVKGGSSRGEASRALARAPTARVDALRVVAPAVRRSASAQRGPASVASPFTAAEIQLMNLAIDLGLQRAAALLQSVREQAQALRF